MNYVIYQCTDSSAPPLRLAILSVRELAGLNAPVLETPNALPWSFSEAARISFGLHECGFEQVGGLSLHKATQGRACGRIL